jgi:hypothetical protein
VLFFPAAGTDPRANGRWSAAFAGLAWLAHGGVAFSFLALLPLLAWRARHGAWRAWLPGAAVLLTFVLPWLVFQRAYDPPGNRLLKWHLGGQEAKDPRGTWETVRDGYARLGWREAWANKVSNFHGQVFGDWRDLGDVSAATAADRRNHEFFHPGRALTWWPVLALLAIAVTRRPVVTPARDLALFTGWLLATTVVWCLLMFGPYTAVIHQGSYALMLGWFVLFSVVLDRAGRGWLGALAGLQAITLGTTWAVGNAAIHGPAAGLPAVLLGAAVLAGFIVTGMKAEPKTSPTEAAVASEPIDRAWRALRAWWREPRLNLGVLAVLAFAFFLRKPHALLTPQLWAEDGSIFLMQNDLHGPAALAMPYMGYLHTLPRVFAWLCSHLLDPAWWPAFYNGVSFALWVAAAARWFSPRFSVPGKPWLALAMVAVPHSGEVFFTLTNLQWMTALVLLQQVLIAAPATRGERWSDLAILALVTLTGPFGVAFLPLFAWRWWRARTGDNATALAVVAACALVQVWFVLRTGPRFDYQDAPLQIGAGLVVLARRLVVWPALGPDLALGLPRPLVAAVGGLFFAGTLGWILRPHPLRIVRAQMGAALLLILAAGLYRARPDTWLGDDLTFSDRYFYIPRVLFVWLLIWEFDTVPRTIALVARVFCLAAAMVHLRDYTLRAPRDYHWAQHVEPIRRGVRADIPILPEGWTLEYRGRPDARP